MMAMRRVRRRRRKKRSKDRSVNYVIYTACGEEHCVVMYYIFRDYVSM
jgi:hypothetical protein